MITLYTLGHSNHPLAKLLHLLQAQRVATLVDVRSNPHSRFHPQYNQKALAAALADQGIAYLFAGHALGGRPKDPLCYTADTPAQVDYALVMQRAWFQQGIADLLETARQSRTTILCSEADPSRCHRHFLIARYLLAHHPEVEVQHILPDGGLLAARILEQQGGSQLRFDVG